MIIFNALNTLDNSAGLRDKSVLLFYSVSRKY